MLPLDFQRRCPIPMPEESGEGLSRRCNDEVVVGVQFPKVKRVRRAPTWNIFLVKDHIDPNMSLCEQGI